MPQLLNSSRTITKLETRFCDSGAVNLTCYQDVCVMAKLSTIIIIIAIIVIVIMLIINTFLFFLSSFFNYEITKLLI